MREPGVLVLADGSVFEGELFGAASAAAGEIVFNTALSGYQEIVTDPSYAGQIITFTNPHIGNYGVNATDDESRRPFCRGMVVRELARRASNRRSEGDLERCSCTTASPASPASTPGGSLGSSVTPARSPARSDPPTTSPPSGREPRPSPAPTASTSSPLSRPQSRTP